MIDRIAVVALVAPLLVGCGADDCADLVFGGREYDEWRTITLSTTAQELGDGSYPACGDRDLDGFGSTDVYVLEGVEPARAVIGYRRGSHRTVVFLRRGAEAPELP